MTNWLITGVGSGLGKALAAAALARGDRVAGTARKPQDVAAFEASAPGRAFGYRLELTDAAATTGSVVRDVYLNVRIRPEIQFQAGQFKVPFAQEGGTGATIVELKE